jgi:DNA excision repair protein ERCC-2
MCPNDIFFCHEDHCPFAKQYQERVLESNVLAQILVMKIMHPDAIIDLAKRYTLCPAEIMLDLTVYSDIIVGDYNYVFDPAVYLKRIFLNQDYSDWILIIDEAHNLYQRGIEYYSPAIKRVEILELIGFHKKTKSKVYKDLLAALERFKELFYTIHEDGELHHEHQQYFEPHLNTQDWQTAFNDYETAFIKYLIYKLKTKLVYPDDPFESLYYSLRHFVTVIKMEGPMYVPNYNAEAGGILKIQCCDPSQHLANRISGFHSVIAMSATLDPIEYYRDILGFTVDRTKTLQLDSPFPTENRKLIIIPGLSTRYKNRNRLYPHYAEIIKEVIILKKGNYIAFLPSFEFLQNINLFLGSINSEKITQQMRMTESDRDSVLESLRNSAEPKLLLAVLGGIFSEGIDFSGDMCIGIIIFSPGLPQITYERELIRRYYENKNGNGFDYAYLYPGINKVIQATGRLIRSYQDKGIVVLVGERFGQEKVNALFPEYWFQKPGDVVFTNSYQKALKDFWDRVDKR